MEVMLTGSTGFLGECVLRQLLRSGARVRCLVRSGSNTSQIQRLATDLGGTIELVVGSLHQVDTYHRALHGCDVLYHVAAAMTGCSAVLFRTNVIATRMLISSALYARVPRCVMVSSIGVHGTTGLSNGDIVDENTPLDPQPHLRDPYTHSKIAQEHVAWEAYKNNGFPVVVVRPGVIYGPGRACISGRVGVKFGKVLFKMGGKQQLPYTYVENCAKAVQLAGTADGVEGESFNIVDDNLPCADWLVNKYLCEVERITVLRVPHSGIIPFSVICEWYHRWSHGQLPAVFTRYKSEAMWKRLRYSNDKAKARLGWHPEVNWEDGFARTFEWLNADAKGLERRAVT